MEALAGIFIILLTILPLLFVFLFYAAILGLMVWFVIVFLRSQKERNQLLRDISYKMGDKNQQESVSPDEEKYDVTEKVVRASTDTETTENVVAETTETEVKPEDSTITKKEVTVESVAEESDDDKA